MCQKSMRNEVEAILLKSEQNPGDLIEQEPDPAMLFDPVYAERHFNQACESLHTIYRPVLRAQDRSLFAFSAHIETQHPTLSTPIHLHKAADLLNRHAELGRTLRNQVAQTLANTTERLEPILLGLHSRELSNPALFTNRAS